MSTNKRVLINRRFAPPRSAYIHVPFCRHRCGYCNFTLVAGRDDLIGQFIRAIALELEQLSTPIPIETLFFGGGTPSHLLPDDLHQLMTTVQRWFLPDRMSEFSMEANPLDITRERMAVLRDHGVTRLSLGVQSFDDRWLRMLERDHRKPDIANAIAIAKESISSISLDLIYGVPGQSLEDWKRDLNAAIDCHPDHISVYGLTYERGTNFWSRLQRTELTACPEEGERSMYELAIDMLSAAKFEHYEVSNFARPGHRCRHNEAYWTGRTYFAAGPGAARHIEGRREMNHRSTTTYLRRMFAGQSPVAESEFLSHEDAARERFVFGLRRLEGIDLDEFCDEIGLSIQALFGQALKRFIELGFLEQLGPQIRLTRKGLLISDSMWPELLSPAGVS